MATAQSVGSRVPVARAAFTGGGHLQSVPRHRRPTRYRSSIDRPLATRHPLIAGALCMYGDAPSPAASPVACAKINAATVGRVTPAPRGRLSTSPHAPASKSRSGARTTSPTARNSRLGTTSERLASPCSVSAARTNATTAWPVSIALRTKSRPRGPVVPKMASRVLPLTALRHGLSFSASASARHPTATQAS